MRYIILFSIITLFYSCKNGPNWTFPSKIQWQGEMLIEDTFFVDKGQTLYIEEGANISFAPGALILAEGDMIIKGTESKPITLTAIDPIGNHRILYGKSGCKKFILHHTNIIDGLITNYMGNTHFQHVNFTNTKKLAWNDAAARFWYGQVLIEDCILNGNNQGEGFLLHDVGAPVIRNCKFYSVPDAIEYLNVKDGKVNNCYFENNGDDAVDLNHCYGIEIEDNVFINVKDRALEIGSESSGSSDSIRINNNLFIGCKVAVNIKESSNAIVRNSTFHNNDISLDVHTPNDSTTLSNGILINSVIKNSRMPISISKRSTGSLISCVSDIKISDEKGNITAPVEFMNEEKLDYTLISKSLPPNTNPKTIGYQKKIK